MSGVPARLASFVRWCPLTFVKAQMIPPAAPEDARAADIVEHTPKARAQSISYLRGVREHVRVVITLSVPARAPRARVRRSNPPAHLRGFVGRGVRQSVMSVPDT